MDRPGLGEARPRRVVSDATEAPRPPTPCSPDRAGQRGGEFPAELQPPASSPEQRPPDPDFFSVGGIGAEQRRGQAMEEGGLRASILVKVRATCTPIPSSYFLLTA